jgi:hypothetical protein
LNTNQLILLVFLLEHWLLLLLLLLAAGGLVKVHAKRDGGGKYRIILEACRRVVICILIPKTSCSKSVRYVRYGTHFVSTKKKKRKLGQWHPLCQYQSTPLRLSHLLIVNKLLSSLTIRNISYLYPHPKATCFRSVRIAPPLLVPTYQHLSKIVCVHHVCACVYVYVCVCCVWARVQLNSLDPLATLLPDNNLDHIFVSIPPQLCSSAPAWSAEYTHAHTQTHTNTHTHTAMAVCCRHAARWFRGTHGAASERSSLPRIGTLGLGFRVSRCQVRRSMLGGTGEAKGWREGGSQSSYPLVFS